MTIQAEASDSDGFGQLVEFFLDNRLVCSVAPPPYTCTVTPAPGDHTIHARAVDGQGLSTTTAPLAITVEVNIDGTNAIPPLLADDQTPVSFIHQRLCSFHRLEDNKM